MGAGRKRRIGILGGISHESTAVYYQQLLARYIACYHDYYFPEIVIFSLDFQRFTDLEDQGETAAYVAYILEGVMALAAAGAEFVVMAANSPHAVYDVVAAQSPVPMLSIAEVTAQAAAAADAQRLLLLGIKFTMQADFYPRVLARYGIDVVTPTDEDQDWINRLIFDELAMGHFTPENRAGLLAVIERTVLRAPVDGVILGCTELPLLLRQGDTPMRLYDTLDLHVGAALAWALGDMSATHLEEGRA